MKIWERHLMGKVLKGFFSSLCSLYLLYAIVHYSIHLQEALQHPAPLLKLLIYYLSLLSEQSPLLLSLSLLIATVSILTSSNQSGELLALQTGGIPPLHLLRPILTIALLCVVLSYLNFQLLPQWTAYAERFEKSFFHKARLHRVKLLLPKEGGKLIYQYADLNEKKLFDVFYMVSTDQIWHMMALSLEEPHPIGYSVDLFKRGESQKIERVAYYEDYPFRELNIARPLQNIPLQKRSIVDLCRSMRKSTRLTRESRAATKTQCYFKLLTPWLAVYTALGVAPFCCRFNRKLPVFSIFACAISGCIAFYAFIHALAILGEAAILPPSLVILAPSLLFLLFFLKYRVMLR